LRELFVRFESSGVLVYTVNEEEVLASRDISSSNSRSGLRYFAIEPWSSTGIEDLAFAFTLRD